MGTVVYEDRPGVVNLSGNFANLQQVDDAVDDYLQKKNTVTILHLQKTTDWQYETEARLISVDFDLPANQFDKPLDGLPVGNALKAVILGEDHVDPMKSASEIRKQLGAHFEVMQCHWKDGLPTLKNL